MLTGMTTGTDRSLNSRSRTGGRPGLVLAIWAATLVALAVLAPSAQAGLGVPFELLSLVMLAPALACAVVIILPRWMPTPWARTSAASVLVAAALSVIAVGVFLAVLAWSTGSSLTWPSGISGVPVLIFVALQTLGALSEEIGWRGVVQRCGERFGRPQVVSAVAGFLFGATHLGYWARCIARTHLRMHCHAHEPDDHHDLYRLILATDDSSCDCAPRAEPQHRMYGAR